MSEWKITSCALCAQNCGLQVQVENNRIVRVRPDRTNPRSQGYVCRKGMKIAYHQHHAERLRHPMKRTDSGFVRISWEQAIGEIAERLKPIIDQHGPRSFAYMGGGGQGSHFEAGFGVSLMKLLGSRYHYNALGQELTGYYWGCGRMLGRQNNFPIPDEHNSDMLLAVGWNGLVSHQMPRAPKVLRAFSRAEDKLLVVIDPRLSETARIANIHLALRPGTDALLVRAMIAIILKEGWEDHTYLEAHTTGLEQLRPLFDGFDVAGAIAECGLEPDAVRRLCQELVRRRWSYHADLGVLMGRHSTLVTYLYLVLASLCGRLCVPGGNVVPGRIMPLGRHSDDLDPKEWRTVTTDYPPILGVYPPNVVPEEILSDHPQRLRAIITGASNPLRSFADTSAYERAFSKLDLLVNIDMNRTATGELAHYMLPSRSAYESYDGTFFAWTFPKVYFQIRQPVLEPEGESLDAGDIYTRLADALGLTPEIPASLHEAAKRSREGYAGAVLAFMQRAKASEDQAPFIIAQTLGPILESTHLALVYGLLLAAPGPLRRDMARAGHAPPPILSTALSLKRWRAALGEVVAQRSPVALASLAPQIAQAEKAFDELRAHPEGIWLAEVDPERNFDNVRTPDGRIHLFVPEMAEWLHDLTPASEQTQRQLPKEYPLVLNAGRHKPENANTLMRDPAWNAGRRDCTLAMHPEDAHRLGAKDGDTVRVVTEAGSVEVDLEVTDDTREGLVLMPHGFGLKHAGEIYGANVNRLTPAANRDRIAGTPLHRFLPCRVERTAT
jgi:anaerobic selenocysteine-containing dehydrogenase